MASTISARQLSSARQALTTLKERVEGGKVKLESLHHPISVGITDDLDSDERLSTTQVYYETIGSISGDNCRCIIIFESVIMHRVEFAVCDEYRSYLCKIVDIDGVIEHMLPTGGKDVVERDLLIGMTNIVNRLFS